MNYRWKRIYLDGDKSRYCIAKVFDTPENMRLAYRKARPGDNIDSASGAHHAYDKLLVRKGKRTVKSRETGTVYLNMQELGMGVVTHELMHAVIWAFKNPRRGFKEQYPFSLKDMREEEELLYRLTYVVRQFYNWYWDVLEPMLAKAK